MSNPSGWTRERRVVLVRETPAIAPVGEHARRRRDTFQPALPGTGDWSASPAPWAGRIAVLVTTLEESAYPAVALARLYRERADAENRADTERQEQALREERQAQLEEGIRRYGGIAQ